MALDLLIRGARVVRATGVEPLCIGIEDGRIAALAPELSGAREGDDRRAGAARLSRRDRRARALQRSRPRRMGRGRHRLRRARRGRRDLLHRHAAELLSADPGRPVLRGQARRLPRRGAHGFRPVGRADSRQPRPAGGPRGVRRRGLQGVHVRQRHRATSAAATTRRCTAACGSPRAWGCRSPCTRKTTPWSACWPRRRARRAAPPRATTWPRAPSRPRRRPSPAPSSFAAETGCKLHVVHTSSARGARLIRAGRGGGGRATSPARPARTTCFSRNPTWSGSARRAKCAPPLRPDAERDQLVALVAEGQVDTIGSDHSPSPPDDEGVRRLLRRLGRDQRGPVHAPRPAHPCRAPAASLARLLSDNVARRFGLPGKGGLRVGADADCVLVDLSDAPIVQAEELFDRHRLSPYVGPGACAAG